MSWTGGFKKNLLPNLDSLKRFSFDSYCRFKLIALNMIVMLTEFALKIQI